MARPLLRTSHGSQRSAALTFQENTMKALRFLGLGVALTLFVTTAMAADTSDAWITMKTKIALLTSEGLSVKSVNVDTVNGTVTLHGQVATDAEKDKAAVVARGITGVKSVNNLVQVVPAAMKKGTRVADDILRERAFAALRSDKAVENVTVASVNNGVVLLSGKVPGLAEELRAIELVSIVEGVNRVASEIQVGSNK